MVDLNRKSQKGTKAPQAAGRIHTDFEKGFIMAEVFKFNDLKEEGSEAAVKVFSVLLSFYPYLFMMVAITNCNMYVF